MKVSTRGRYGLKLAVDLAMYSEEGKLENIKNIAERRNLSEKYLERIVGMLRKAGIVESVRGAYGGYRLVKSADEITVNDVLNAVEDNMIPVECLVKETDCGIDCEKCATQKFWNEMWVHMKEVTENVTLEDLAETYRTLEEEKEEIK